MKIPVVSDAVCLAVSNEIIRKGIPYLVEGLEHIEKTQPILYRAMGLCIQNVTPIHGQLASETMMRLMVIQYKMIETQFEVDDLEGNYET